MEMRVVYFFLQVADGGGPSLAKIKIESTVGTLQHKSLAPHTLRINIS